MLLYLIKCYIVYLAKYPFFSEKTVCPSVRMCSKIP